MLGNLVEKACRRTPTGTRVSQSTTGIIRSTFLAADSSYDLLIVGPINDVAQFGESVRDHQDTHNLPTPR